MDNSSLVNESKQKRLTPNQDKLLREQFLYANVLIGLSLLLEDKKIKRDEKLDDHALRDTIEERIEWTCRSMAPFIPALVSLGSSELESDRDFDGFEEIG